MKSVKTMQAGVCLLGAVALVPVVGVRLPFVDSTDPNVAAIQQVIASALAADQQTDIRPVGLPASGVPATEVQAFMQHVPGMTPDQVQAWHQQIEATLARYHTGTRLAQLNRVIWDHAQIQTAAGVEDIELASGADDIQFKNIAVTGDNATALVEATKWTRFAHRGNGRVDIITTPPSAALYKYQLVWTAAGWRISELTDFTILTNAP